MSYILLLSRHTASLATYVRNMLFALRHDNGSSVCKLYGVDNSKVCIAMKNTVFIFIKVDRTYHVLYLIALTYIFFLPISLQPNK